MLFGFKNTGQHSEVCKLFNACKISFEFLVRVKYVAFFEISTDLLEILSGSIRMCSFWSVYVMYDPRVCAFFTGGLTSTGLCCDNDINLGVTLFNCRTYQSP